MNQQRLLDWLNKEKTKDDVEIEKYKKADISKERILESFQGWNAYAEWADSYKLRKSVFKRI